MCQENQSQRAKTVKEIYWDYVSALWTWLKGISGDKDQILSMNQNQANW